MGEVGSRGGVCGGAKVGEALNGEMVKAWRGWSRGQDEALGRVRDHLFQEPE